MIEQRNKRTFLIVHLGYQLRQVSQLQQSFLEVKRRNLWLSERLILKLVAPASLSDLNVETESDEGPIVTTISEELINNQRFIIA